MRTFTAVTSLAAAALAITTAQAQSFEDVRTYPFHDQIAAHRAQFRSGEFAATNGFDCSVVQGTEPGAVTDVKFPSFKDGEIVSINVFTPSANPTGDSHPVILEGHGYSGSKRGSPSDIMSDLMDNGYYIISIDQRGHGQAGGTVRIMDPNFEGMDLIQILDFTQACLPNVKTDKKGVVAGALGGSYGGGYQFLLHAVDPEHRLRAISPTITWHDLDGMSIAPGGVVRSQWGALLAALGDTGTGFSSDPKVRQYLVDGASDGLFSQEASDFFYYHSPAYHCNERELVGPDFILPPGTFESIPTLIYQGPRDTLFTLVESIKNYNCMKDVAGSSRDVFHLSSSTSHALPTGNNLNPTNLGQELMEGTGNAGSACGRFDERSTNLAFFQSYMRGIGNFRRDHMDLGLNEEKYCWYLGQSDDGQVDAVRTTGNPIGGQLIQNFNEQIIPLNPTTIDSPMAMIPIGAVVPEDGVIAGIPQVELFISLPGGQDVDPISPNELDDTVMFLGIGRLAADSTYVTPQLVDHNVWPVLGVTNTIVDLAGVSERVYEGDRLFLMVYNAHQSFSPRPPTATELPAVQIDGTVRLPYHTLAEVEDVSQGSARDPTVAARYDAEAEREASNGSAVRAANNNNNNGHSSNGGAASSATTVYASMGVAAGALALAGVAATVAVSTRKQLVFERNKNQMASTQQV